MKKHKIFQSVRGTVHTRRASLFESQRCHERWVCGLHQSDVGCFSSHGTPYGSAGRLLQECHTKYINITSLYPFINKNGKYPIGHPWIMRGNEWEFDMSYPIEKRYFGFVYCRVLPPNNLLHPVLPYSVPTGDKSTKLMFVLCRTCAEERQFELDFCRHNEYQRSFEAVFVSTELDKALQKGY